MASRLAYVVSTCDLVRSYVRSIAPPQTIYLLTFELARHLEAAYSTRPHRKVQYLLPWFELAWPLGAT